MSSARRKFQLLLAFAALAMLALAAGCRGFFVNAPNSVTITPNTVSLTQGQTSPLTAQASFDSGSKDVTASATWSSSNSCGATVTTGGSTAGKVTDVGTGSPVTITANFDGVTGTATVTIPTGITISPCGTFTNGTTQQFSANLSGSDVTSSSTWTSDTSRVTFSSVTPGLASFVGTGTATITANNGTVTGTLQITVQ